MADYNPDRRPIPKNSARAYRQRVLDEAANYRDQATQTLNLSAAMLTKTRELIAKARQKLRQTERVADHEDPAESVPGKAKSGSVPYSVATQPHDNLTLNRQLQAEQLALLERNRELRQSIKNNLKRHSDALRRAEIRKR